MCTCALRHVWNSMIFVFNKHHLLHAELITEQQQLIKTAVPFTLQIFFLPLRAVPYADILVNSHSGSTKYKHTISVWDGAVIAKCWLAGAVRQLNFSRGPKGNHPSEHESALLVFDAGWNKRCGRSCCVSALMISSFCRMCFGALLHLVSPSSWTVYCSKISSDAQLVM